MNIFPCLLYALALLHSVLIVLVDESVNELIERLISAGRTLKPFERSFGHFKSDHLVGCHRRHGIATICDSKELKHLPSAEASASANMANARSRTSCVAEDNAWRE